VVYAIGMILIYVGFRFDFRFSPGVVIALVHDAIITLGFLPGQPARVQPDLGDGDPDGGGLLGE